MAKKLAGEKDPSPNLVLVSTCLLAITFFIRLPFFFNIVIDWDESTFILMAQSLLDGHLPYTDLWEIKPPLLFVPYAAAIALLGKSIVSVRILGALFVAITAILTYLVGRKLLDHFTAFLMAILTVIAIGAFPSGQAVMAEHIALLPLVGALCILTLRPFNLPVLFIAGLLLGSATFIRLNLAYVAVITGGFIFVISFLEPPRAFVRSIKNCLAYAVGGSVVLILVLLPYAVNGLQKLWWDSVVGAAFTYAGSQRSFTEALSAQTANIITLVSSLGSPFIGVNMIVWLGGAAGLAVIILRWTKEPLPQKKCLALLLTFIFSTLLSILKGGAAWSHYLIQLTPFMALAAGFLVKVSSHVYTRRIACFVVILACAVSLLSPLKEYQFIASRIMTGLPPHHGSAYAIADYIKKNNPLHEPVYMMTDHIVYWLIDATPLSKSTTHPSNISRPWLLAKVIEPGASTSSELAKVLALKPAFIIKTRFIPYLQGNLHAGALLEKALRTNYLCVGNVEGRLIFRRMN